MPLLTDRHAMGGYFEFELGTPGTARHPEALHFQSARACLQALLLAGRPRRVWIPWFICETMAEQARIVGVEVIRYAIQQDFTVAAGVDLGADDWILYVNYFGLCDEQVTRTLQRFGPEQVILDNCHALYAKPRECLATIYSPRKFVALPDGGCLVTRLDVPEPLSQDQDSAQRCVPLLKRSAEGPESGYDEYRRSEESLEGQAPLRMSALTRRMLSSVDYQSIAARRRANFEALHRSLAGTDAVPFRLDAEDVPLAYPYLKGSHSLRQFLVSHRVYAHHFWPHLREAGHEVPAFERHLAEACIPLPCDQRYEESDMDYLAALVREHESKGSADKP